MQSVKATHTVGDPIHIQLFFLDDRATFKYYGHVVAARKHPSSHFPEQILYDLSLQQPNAPDICITNLPKGFVRAGGPEIEENV